MSYNMFIESRMIASMTLEAPLLWSALKLLVLTWEEDWILTEQRGANMELEETLNSPKPQMGT